MPRKEGMIYIPRAVMQDVESGAITHLDLAAYCYLRVHQSEKPKHIEIAQGIGLTSRFSVIASMKRLEAAGHVVMERRGGQGEANTYGVRRKKDVDVDGPEQDNGDTRCVGATTPVSLG